MDYSKAILFFGGDGAAGESNALANYCAILNSGISADYAERVLERCADEANHLLGDFLDGLKLSGIRIAADGLDEILDELRALKGE